MSVQVSRTLNECIQEMPSQFGASGVRLTFVAILISGICGFVGSALARALLDRRPDRQIFGFDNFSLPGSHINSSALQELGIKVFHADARQASDIENLPQADWIIDAAANPSVLAGLDGRSSMRQVVENNLLATVNLLEYARRHQAGFILLSSSRVYSIPQLQTIPLRTFDEAFAFDDEVDAPVGVSSSGIAETFSTAAPISLYGSTKLSSEILALEYGESCDFPVWIDRCGVIAGAGQFGRADQGIFAFWINAYLRRQPLKYVGYGGTGHQVRDCIHPTDLASLIEIQMASTKVQGRSPIYNIGGGVSNAMSLRQLSKWCGSLGAHDVASVSEERAYDVPWVIMDGRRRKRWNSNVRWEWRY